MTFNVNQYNMAILGILPVSEWTSDLYREWRKFENNNIDLVDFSAAQINEQNTFLYPDEIVERYLDFITEVVLTQNMHEKQRKEFRADYSQYPKPEKNEYPNKLSPESKEKLLNDYKPVSKHLDKIFMHKDVVDHVMNDVGDVKKQRVGKILKHLNDKGYEHKDIEDLTKEKKSGVDVKGPFADALNKSGLRHFHIPQVTARNTTTTTGNRVMFYHRGESGNYYIHGVADHNKSDQKYMSHGQHEIMKRGSHLLEAVHFFQQRYLKNLLK